MTKSPDAKTDTASIDLSDMPELDEAWFRTARLHKPGDRPQRPMRIDSDIIEYFRQQTNDDQEAINAVLRTFVERAREKAG